MSHIALPFGANWNHIIRYYTVAYVTYVAQAILHDFQQLWLYFSTWQISCLYCSLLYIMSSYSLFWHFLTIACDICLHFCHSTWDSLGMMGKFSQNILKFLLFCLDQRVHETANSWRKINKSQGDFWWFYHERTSVMFSCKLHSNAQSFKIFPSS